MDLVLGLHLVWKYQPAGQVRLGNCQKSIFVIETHVLLLILQSMQSHDRNLFITHIDRAATVQDLLFIP